LTQTSKVDDERMATMASYNDRLQREIARRDTAIVNMERSGLASVSVATLAVRTKVEQLKARMNLENIIRQHPWGTTISALLAGTVAVPLIQSIHNLQSVDHQPSETLPSPNESTATVESKWKPVLDAIRANLPTLIAAYSRQYSQPATDANGLAAEGEPANTASMVRS